jgi:hypothetical protein
MTITRTTGGAGLPAGLPFSLATEVGGVCFISGMPALAPDGSFQAGDFAQETSQAWHNVVAIAGPRSTRGGVRSTSPSRSSLVRPRIHRRLSSSCATRLTCSRSR